MRTMLWIILFQFIAGAVNAQYADYPKLEKLFAAQNYDKCIKKAEKYAKKDRKQLMPQVYIMKSWLKIDDDPKHKENKRALNKALSAARKIQRKDADLTLFDRFIDDFVTLQLKAFEKADAQVAEGKCSNAIRIYDNINEVFDDATSAYKKSLCLLQSDFQKQEGFVLLRNTMLKTYSSFKKGNSYEKLPAGFARLSREYLQRRYYYNAEDILRKGIEMYPTDTAIQNEVLQQTTQLYQASITSDYQKDLQKLRNQLLWADSSYNNYAPVVAMLKQTNENIIKHYIKFEYEDINKTQQFIAQCQKHQPQQYTTDSINNFLTSLYGDKEIRRIDGALDNLTKVLIGFNNNPSDGAKNSTRMVFDYIINQGNYEVAAYFIKQVQKLYPQDKKMPAAMQQTLETLLVELLTDIETDEISIDLAQKFTTIAPKNKKLQLQEQQLYIDVLKLYQLANNYSAFFSVVNKGLGRYPTHPTMQKLKKEMVVKDFTTNYTPNLITDVKEMKVICHVPSCVPGKVAPDANQKFINVLNYLRRQAGVYDSCFLDADLSEMAQEAALMMKAKNTLNHSPDSTWKCFTRKGKKAAGSSNLSLGYAGTDALMGQMRDDGASNGSVGHRRWILNPTNKVFGHGSNDNAMALYVFGKYFNDPEKDQAPDWDATQFISWPPKDFAPLTIVPKRWSFSLENADFGKAQISVSKKGKRVNIKPEKVENGYAINTCVWSMETDIKAGDVYTITLKNISVFNEPEPKTYTYTIEILDL